METTYYVPKELLFKLFSHFNPLELAQTALINQDLNVIANENSLWQRFLLDPLPAKLASQNARDVFSEYPEFIRPEYRDYQEQHWLYNIEKQLKQLKQNPCDADKANVFEALIPLMKSQYITINQALLVKAKQLEIILDPEVRKCVEDGLITFDEILEITDSKKYQAN